MAMQKIFEVRNRINPVEVENDSIYHTIKLRQATIKISYGDRCETVNRIKKLIQNECKDRLDWV